MKISLVLAMLLAALLAPPGLSARTAAHGSSVLAIHFTSEVNPVTQDWLNGQLDRAAQRTTTQLP